MKTTIMKNHISPGFSTGIRNVIVLLVLTILYTPQKGQAQDIGQIKDIGLYVGVGLTSGNDYSDDLKKAINGEVTGYLGWINIDLGLQLKVVKNLYVSPQVRWMSGGVKTVVEGFEFAPNQKANSVFLFGGSLKYYVTDYFYGQASLSYITTASETNNLVYESDGIETGIAIGAELGSDKIIGGIEVGYTLVPVIEGGLNKRNYGGIFINLKTRFQFGNYK